MKNNAYIKLYFVLRIIFWYIRIIESEKTCPMCSEKIDVNMISSTLDIHPYLDFQEEKSWIKNLNISIFSRNIKDKNIIITFMPSNISIIQLNTRNILYNFIKYIKHMHKSK